ncbi:MAG: TIM barrel protein [Planctomycetes bacterium]|nr:TIM barrel protein [Planctomycetota bacterium]
MKTKKEAATRKNSSARTSLGRPLFGSHLSIAGGLENALISAKEYGFDCVQIFVKNQRQWKSKPLTDDQVQRFAEAKRATGMTLVAAHANYLLNLASPDDRVRKGSIDVLADELTRCETLGIACLMFHPGAHLSEDRSSKVKVRKQSAERKRGDALQSRDREGADEQLPIAEFQLPIEKNGIRNAERDGIKRIAESLDEIAAGYDFRTPESYAAMMDEMDRVIGVAPVKCIHTNDSKRELGSRVDRHEHIGKGKIGKSGFANFINDSRWHGIPMILETPKGVDDNGKDFDKMNLKVLRSLIRK